jgi:hypothetical protein
MAFDSNWKGHANGCACRKSNLEVLMVKSAEEWLGSAGDIDGTRQRSILTER